MLSGKRPVPSGRNKLLFIAAKTLIAVAVLWGVGRTLRSGIRELQSSQLELHAVWLGVSAAFYVLSMVPAGLFWRRVMIAMGERPPVWLSLRAYCIGHLGKYVPGKALVIVLRAGLLRSAGVNAAVAAISVFFETLTMMAVGACIGAIVLAMWRPEEPLHVLGAAAFVVLASLPIVPPVLKRLLRWTAVGKRYPKTSAKITQVGYGTLAAGWGGMAVGWILQGLSLWATLRAIGADQSLSVSSISLYTGCVALAVVAGFASFIPGGLVVRDLVLTAVLAPQLGDSGEAQAIAASLLLRLVWLVAELGISVILYFAAGERWSAASKAAVDDPSE